MTLVDQAQPIERRTLHDELVERVRSLVTAGALKPGEKIPERELCERFGVSRTPLREALKVLAADGLVRLTPNRGATVSLLTIDELEDVFPVMGALEALAGEIACQNITDREIARARTLHERMVAHWKAGELGPYFACNQQIHELILDATRNAALHSVYRSLATRIMSARYVANMTPERWKKAVDEHEHILSALEARDGVRLSAILKDHLNNKLDTVRQWLTAEQAQLD